MKCTSILSIQLKIIAVLEMNVSAFLLGLNVKILVQLFFGHVEHKPHDDGEGKSRNLSENALIMYFLIRVIYLFGEFLLAIFLSYNVYKRNVNGLILWFFMTIIFSIPSRCYFIDGILWDHYFMLALLIFCANLTFTIYSLVIIYLHVKYLTKSVNYSSSRRESLAGGNNETDTYLDYL